MATIVQTLPARCRHGRQVGAEAIAGALGAFVERPQATPDHHDEKSHVIAGTLRIAIKDNIDVVGWPTRAGSKAISREPASRDAVVVTRLREAGILIGSKTRMDEFAMTTSGPGMRNPADHSRSAGGSSGGSAIAVAVGGYCAALGTDTGGSSRVPAAYCGVVGFKPTFGGVPTDGVVPLSPSLDHVGILGCSVSAVREVFRVVGNAEDRSEVRPWGTSRRLGIPRDSYLAAASIEVRRAFARTVDRLRQQGWETVEVDLPSPQLVLSAHYAIAGYELVRYQDLRFKTLAKHGKNVQAIIKRARGYSDRDYRIALAARDASVGSAWRLFDDIDLLALPTTPTVAPEPGTETFRLDDRTVDAVSGAIWYTALFNDTGLPAVSVPFMGQRGLPIGIQLVSQWGQDNLLLDVAEQIN